MFLAIRTDQLESTANANLALLQRVFYFVFAFWCNLKWSLLYLINVTFQVRFCLEYLAERLPIELASLLFNQTF